MTAVEAFKYSRYRLSVDIDKSLSIIMDGGVFCMYEYIYVIISLT